MTRVLFILLIATGLTGCKPPNIIYSKWNTNTYEDMPKMCEKEHLLFYEIRNDSTYVTFWLRSNMLETIERISKNGIQILSSDKNKKKVHTIVKYHEKLYTDKGTKRKDTEQQIVKILNIKDKDTLDVTSLYNISLNSSIKNNSFEMKLSIPQELFFNNENPVAGIIIPKIKPGIEETPKRKPKESPHYNQYGQRGGRPGTGNLTYVNHNQQSPHSQKIEIWFQLFPAQKPQ